LYLPRGLSKKTIVIGTALQVIAFALETASPNFPVWVLAYTVYGFSTALQVWKIYTSCYFSEFWLV